MIYTQWNGEIFCSYGSSNSRGTAILFNRNIDIQVKNYYIDENGNYVILDLCYEESCFTLINLYGPNTDTPSFFEKIFKKIEDIGNDSYIICGDFNCVMDPNLDYMNYKQVNNKLARQKLIESIQQNQLTDTYRELHPESKRYTWRRRNPLQQARLDYFLTTPDFTSNTEKCDIEPSINSDHSVVILHLKWNDFVHGKGLWKHNNMLLKDINYITKIRKKIQEVKKQYCVPVYEIDNINNIHDQYIQFIISDQLFLDTLLMEIRGESISYGSFIKKQTNLEEKDLIQKIKDLEENLNEENKDDLANNRERLNELRKNKLKGHFIRSKARWVENGEKPSNFFCNLEKQNYVNKTINKLETENGELIHNQQDILKETKMFYKKLYESRDLNDTDIDIDIDISYQTKLDNDQQEKLTGYITYKEAGETLKNMKNDKSPGSDGFTADFFKVFWKDIGHFVVRSINSSFDEGALSFTQKQGIITCIPKENKPRQFLKNWRPITLLNTVYKIASGSIANRLKSILPLLVSKEQTGFLKGRYIGENIRLIYDIMHYTEEKNIPALLLFIDFEKAFDSLSWRFMFETLDFFNFGESFKRWIALFYNGIQSSVLQNGFLSDFFDIGRGCRQGDPLSPYIFILCAEILTLKIKSNKKIKGISINGVMHVLSQFADDTSIILDGTPDSLTSTLDELSNFEKLSGLKVNFDKTHVIWIGKEKFSSKTIKTKFKLAWGVTEFKLLGVNFHMNLEQMVKKNYEDRIERMKKMINFWKRRYLSPLGKITVVKTLFIPIFNHLFISLPNPTENILKSINDIFFDFIWQGPSKIKKSVIIKDYSEGGLRMINVSNFIQSLKCTWIRRLTTADGTWTSLTSHFINIEKLLNCGKDYPDSLVERTSNCFWKDVLRSYSNVLGSTKITNKYDFLSCPLFYNKDLLIGGKSFFFKSWYDKGLRYINDLVEGSRILNHSEIERKYDLKVNFIHYIGVYKILKILINTVKEESDQKILSNPLRPFNQKILTKHTSGSRCFYDILCKNDEEPTSKQKWIKLYKDSIIDWKQIYALPFNVTKDSAIQWLQVRILHRFLPLNKYLYTLKLKDDEKCALCKREVEQINHLFFSCPKTKQLLTNIKCILIEKDINLDLNEIEIILGSNCNKINLLMLQFKNYVYLSRQYNKNLTLDLLKKYMKIQIDVNKHILKLKNIDELDKNWDYIVKIVES